MIKRLIIVIIIGTTLKGFSQESYKIENRKGGLFFSVGTEYRITPIYSLSSQFSETSNAVNIDKQNSGVAFSYSFDYFVAKNLSLGFTNTFRYGMQLQPLNQIESDFGFKETENTLIFGYHFYLDYHFKIFKKSEIFVRVGKSLLNRGTDFIDKVSFYDNNGNSLGNAQGINDFNYQPWNFGLGYKKRKISLIGGVYSSSVTNYFQDGSSFVVPYITFKYNLGKL